jgi:hypothetical protein
MEMELSQLIGWAITLLGGFAGLVTALVKLLLIQVEARLAERFAAQDEARQAASRHWEQNFEKVLARQDKDSESVQQLEKALLRFQADLPVNYVRREDYVRGQSLVEAKLDGVAMLIQNITLKGAKHAD